jgi:hypothetical protein
MFASVDVKGVENVNVRDVPPWIMLPAVIGTLTLLFLVSEKPEGEVAADIPSLNAIASDRPSELILGAPKPNCVTVGGAMSGVSGQMKGAVQCQ